VCGETEELHSAAQAGGGEHRPQNRQDRREAVRGRAISENTTKPPVNAPCAPAEPHPEPNPEKDTQIQHRMPVSDKRQLAGRKHLSETVRRQTQKMQCLRRNPRAIQRQTRREDQKSKSGDCGSDKSGKRINSRGLTV